MAKYDWALIKREYVQGIKGQDGTITCPTLDDLCEKYGCALSTIMKRSASEKWSTERKIFGRKKEESIEKKKIEVLAEESANIDNLALTVAEKGMKIVNERLDDKNLSNHDALKLSKTASTFHKMGKLALGEPTEHIRNEGRHDVNFNTTSQQRILKQEGYTG